MCRLPADERCGVHTCPPPSTDLPETLVAKDRNEEGGMGIHIFDNAAHGGRWILQRRLANAAPLAELLPPNAPLSTFRIITASRGGLTRASIHDLARREGDSQEQALARAKRARPAIAALSCVWRAGRAGAATDHSSVLFDVDLATGTLRRGTTNAHWYALGPSAPFTTPLTSHHDQVAHPDSGAVVAGGRIQEAPAMQELVCRAHAALLPDVPMAGWDVALTPDGMCLLEVNLSCNFFRGAFSEAAHWAFVDEYWAALDVMRRSASGIQSSGDSQSDTKFE